MIVPFWADVDTTRGGTVHYRESMDRQQLKKVGTEVSNAYPDQSPITLAWSFVVTWDNVAFFGAGSSCGGISKRNTFQVIKNDLKSRRSKYYSKFVNVFCAGCPRQRRIPFFRNL